MNEISIDGVIYVVKQAKSKSKAYPDGDDHPNVGDYVVIRTYSAGVHVGTLVCKKGREVILSDARRIWGWDGAASLSQLAADGVSKPQNCKFSVAVASITLLESIEIIPCTDAAKINISRVPEWKV